MTISNQFVAKFTIQLQLFFASAMPSLNVKCQFYNCTKHTHKHESCTKEKTKSGTHTYRHRFNYKSWLFNYLCLFRFEYGSVDRSTTHYRRRYFGPPVFTQSVFCLRKQIIRAIFYRYCFINSKHPYVVPLTIYNKYNSGSQNICV
jgi:hypothetical protein